MGPVRALNREITPAGVTGAGVGAYACGPPEDLAMSLDRSLKTKGKLSGVRSVMTRPERIEALKAEKRLNEAKGKALGLPKTRVNEG
ncbi:MAG: hypothetical protein DHS20C14_07230 [Phycisphaeraceae bacterium]|nr:MAG: hypothetical protein DHS20C14_07230 [Phycisphaeraceae bacterium]